MHVTQDCHESIVMRSQFLLISIVYAASLHILFPTISPPPLASLLVCVCLRLRYLSRGSAGWAAHLWPSPRCWKPEEEHWRKMRSGPSCWARPNHSWTFLTKVRHWPLSFSAGKECSPCKIKWLWLCFSRSQFLQHYNSCITALVCNWHDGV